MIVVIQCAATKHLDAGRFKSPDGKSVIFVADPRAAPADTGIYARPDDQAQIGITWRDLLLSYNNAGDNQLGLFPAYRLYENRTYGQLANRFGLDKLYILSAGWGLISSGFLTPYYDITFSPSAEAYKRRRKTDRYRDFCMMPMSTDEPIVFFGGKDYVPLFCALTKLSGGKRTVFYNSAIPPNAPGCTLERFETATRTNWHYECAGHFLNSARAERF
jgi:hypothetical protein